MYPIEEYVGGLCGKTNKVVSSRKFTVVLNVGITVATTVILGAAL